MTTKQRCDCRAYEQQAKTHGTVRVPSPERAGRSAHEMLNRTVGDLTADLAGRIARSVDVHVRAAHLESAPYPLRIGERITIKSPAALELGHLPS